MAGASFWAGRREFGPGRLHLRLPLHSSLRLDLEHDHARVLRFARWQMQLAAVLSALAPSQSVAVQTEPSRGVATNVRHGSRTSETSVARTRTGRLSYYELIIQRLINVGRGRLQDHAAKLCCPFFPLPGSLSASR